jgi:hypothetical protein
MVEKKCAETTELLWNTESGCRHTVWWTKTPKPQKMKQTQKHLTILGITLACFHSRDSSLLSLCWAPKSCYQLENVTHNTQIETI